MISTKHDGEYQRLVDQQFDQILRDAETAVSRLRETLAARHAQEMHPDEVDRLAVHLARTSAWWSQARFFLDQMAADLQPIHEHEERQQSA